MIHALCAGRVVSPPTTGTTKTDKPFARVTIACQAGGETDMMVGVFTMDEASIRALESVRKGDTIAAQGSLQENTYTAKDGTQRTGFSLSFARVLTAQSPKREKKPREKPAGPSQAAYRAAAHAQRGDGELRDDVPW